jgi:hypothetical protein
MLDRRAWGRALRLLSWALVLAGMLLSSRTASAYPWMIRHQYAGCVPCHADPSGAGLLTEYGRAQGDILLRSRYGVPPPDEGAKSAAFLWGVPTPDWLLAGGSLRGGVYLTKNPSGSTSAFTTRWLEMEADLKAQITVSRFRAYGSLGYMHENALTTQITHRAADNLVSREHWIGVDLGEDKQYLLRAGRIDIPFGIRNDEHDLLVRSTQVTRTNINESQQHGVAFSANSSSVRGEVMALLGNYQLNPDVFRERGYAGFVEFSLAPWASVGASSMVTYARQDYLTQADKTIRQVHGAFTRFAPKEPIVVMAEIDALVTTTSGVMGMGAGTSPGFVSMLQVDMEPTQGLHLIATGEAMVTTNTPTPTGVMTARSFDGGAAVLWFFAPHVDLRFDFVATSVMNGTTTIFLLPQIHAYL